MHITCTSCHKEISAENLNIDKLIAKCSACNTVFSFEDQVQNTGGGQKMSYENMPIPEGFTVHREPDHLLIERQWQRLPGVFMLIFALVWNSMIWGIFMPAFSLGFESIFGLFLLPFILVGIYLAYAGLASLVNSTKIRVDNQNLTVRHGPIPMPGRQLLVKDIDQLYTRQRIRYGKSGPSTSYELLAIRVDARELMLLQGLESPEFAIFIESEVETYLAIHDRPVPGEYVKQ